MSQYKLQIQDGEGNNLMPKTIAEAVTLEDGTSIETLLTTVAPDAVAGHVANTDIHVTTTDKTNWNSVVSSANAYVDTKITDLIAGASTTMDTLKEIADVITNDNSVVKALNDSITNKANTSDFSTHTGNTDIHVTSTEKTTWGDAVTAATNNQTMIELFMDDIGVWLPTQTLATGDTTLTITSSLIKTTSIIDIYYAITDGVTVTETQTDGSITITLDTALTENCDINVRVVNLV